MDTHPIDPTALICGLLFGLGGFAILADQQWHDLDITAFTAAGVVITAILLLGFVVFRFVTGLGVAPETELAEDPSDQADTPTS